MKIKINGYTIDKCANLNVSLIHDSIASTFGFDFYWDPFDPKMRDLMLPGNYQECIILSDSGEILITGVCHSPSFSSSANPSLKSISGYSRTGVLGDCEFAAILPTQQNGKTLLQICQDVSDYFGLGSVVDNSGGVASTVIDQANADPNVDCAAYLSKFTKDLGITLSHNNLGNLVLSIPKQTKPLFNFTGGMPGVKIDLQVNGQKMHSSITCGTDGGTQQGSTVKNPYVQQKAKRALFMNMAFNSTTGTNIKNEYATSNRPSFVLQQTDTKNITTLDTANQALADELREGISVTITMNGWLLNNTIAQPNTIISIQEPEIYLFKAAKFFVYQVDFSGTEKEETAILSCCLPECFIIPADFNATPPVNIFTDKGNNTTFTNNDPSTPLRSQDRKALNL